MLVILTVFFYLYAGFSFSSLNSADNGLLFIRCEVQIPTVMTVINGSDAAHEFLNYITVDASPFMGITPDIQASRGTILFTKATRGRT